MTGSGAATFFLAPDPGVTLSLSKDLPTWLVWLAVALAVISCVFLLIELRRSGRGRGRHLAIFAASTMGLIFAILTVLRPVRVYSRTSERGSRVLVLLDGSRSMDLPLFDSDRSAAAGTRREVLGGVVARLQEHFRSSGTTFFSFGEGELDEVSPAAAIESKTSTKTRSDLAEALRLALAKTSEPPELFVVVSDGRLTRPTAEHAGDVQGFWPEGASTAAVATVSVAEKSPADASVRLVSIAGAAVAHQPSSLRVEVACAGLACAKIPVRVRELIDDGSPEVLARGEVDVTSGAATVELPITLNRAGPRVIEVEIESPKGDELPENDRRFSVLDVARDRIRLLHVAGRPTYDVRALRMWLKANESVDLVAFFILRTPSSNVGASPSELALIPFPVDELFSVHLPSFDAVILQDFDAELYRLSQHLGSLARYVDSGGGLIMVGGPDAFARGGYADSPLAKALPIELDAAAAERGADLAWFEPSFTEAGKSAPILSPLRDIVGDAFGEMPGTNIVGKAKPGATVLLEHPKLIAGGAPMPILSLTEFGAGRTIALTIDGSHRLLFSKIAERGAGRAHGALWSGLLGWLMRDPRFEMVGVDLPSGCLAGVESRIVVRPLPQAKGTAELTVRELGTGKVVTEQKQPLAEGGTTFTLRDPKPGGFAATVVLVDDAGHRSPPTRRDFACEVGGDEWADPRPDIDRLKAIAAATGGQAVSASDVDTLTLPKKKLVHTERREIPVAPPWVWALGAAAFLGGTFVLRRRSGLA